MGWLRIKIDFVHLHVELGKTQFWKDILGQEADSTQNYCCDTPDFYNDIFNEATTDDVGE